MALLLVQPSDGQVNIKLPQVEAVKHQAYTETIKGVDRESKAEMTARFDMVPIPGGVYLMGSPDSEPGRTAGEGPQHPVRIRPFFMAKTEVTWDEFDVWWKEQGATVADENDAKRKKDPEALTGPTPTYVDADYGHGHSGHPVICMSHHCAMEYCRWLAKKTGKPYRLPTEAEWEWACRAGTTTPYFYGTDPKQLGDYGWYVKNAPFNEGEDPQTHKVATRKPNPWGLHDMYGNVWEWCVDHYEKDYSKYPKDKISDWPVTLPGGKYFPHVVRGGSWSDEADRCRSATRRGSDKSWIKDDPQRPQSIWWLTRMDMIGFRVVCPVEEQPELKGIKSKVTRESEIQ
jgi:formylglycine-generating enzyme required for sulfatase activity